LKYRYIHIIFFVLITVSSYAQKDSTAIVNLFKKSKARYEVTDYKIETVYEAYITKKEDSLVGGYKGVAIKDGTYNYSKMNQTEMIQEGKKLLVISHSEKTIQYSDVEASQKKITQVGQIEQILPFFDSYKHKKTTEGYRCEFGALKLNQLPFSRVVLFFDEIYNLREQILYMASSIPYKDKGEQKLAKSKLVLKMSDVLPLSGKEVKPKISSFITIVGEEVKLRSSFKNYQHQIQSWILPLVLKVLR